MLSSSLAYLSFLPTPLPQAPAATGQSFSMASWSCGAGGAIPGSGWAKQQPLRNSGSASPRRRQQVQRRQGAVTPPPAGRRAASI